MVKNQLFRVLPDTEIIQTLLEIFGLTSLEDNEFLLKIRKLNKIDILFKKIDKSND